MASRWTAWALACRPAGSPVTAFQCATTSHPQHEPTAVTELTFTPGAPRTIQIGVDYRV